MIAVVDYRKGNIRSVVRALGSVGARVEVVDSPSGLMGADGVVLPGVGAFNDAMCSLEDAGLDRVLRDAIAAEVPFLGICLGMHVLFEGGMEHAPCGKPRAGLGVLPGIVRALPAFGPGEGSAEGACATGGSTGEVEMHAFKLPHVGWNSVEPVADDGGLFAGIPAGERFYFTHSFASPASPFTVCETTHSVAFPSVVRKGNAWGVQFHPEKSSSAGERLLANFIAMCA